LQYNRVQGWQLSPDDEAKVQAARARALRPAAEAVAGGADMREIVSTMMAGFQSTVAQLLETRQPPDPFAQAEKLAGLVRTLMPAAAPAAPDFMTVLGMVKAFNDATGAGKAVIPSDASATDTILIEAARAFMPAVAAGIQNKQGALPAGGDRRKQLKGPQLTEEQQEKIMFLQLKLKSANRVAEKGGDPVTYADDIYTAFDDDDIRGFAFDPEWFKFLVEAVPDCAKYEAWYNAVRLTLLDISVEDGILARDEAGNLTIPPEDDSLPETDKAGDGTTDTATTSSEPDPIKP
jgi:hypothetical protein